MQQVSTFQAEVILTIELTAMLWDRCETTKHMVTGLTPRSRFIGTWLSDKVVHHLSG